VKRIECCLIILFWILVMHIKLPSQQVAVNIPIGNKTNESGWHIDAIGDDYIITTQVRCKLDEDVPSEGCCAMMRVNRKGQVLWKKLMEFETNYFSRPGHPDCYTVRNDSFIVSGFVNRNDTMFLRLFIVHGSGSLLKQIDYYFPQFDWNVGIISLNDGYLVCNLLRDTTQEGLDYQFIKLDRAFRIVKEARFGKPTKTVYEGSFILLKDSTVLIAMDEYNKPQPGKNIRIIKINSNLNLLSEVEVNNNTVDPKGRYPIIKRSKDSSIFIWHYKTVKLGPGIFPFPITLFKYNSNYQMLFEREFSYYGVEYVTGDMVLTEDQQLYFCGNLFNSGGMGNLAWLRKMDLEGNLLWERIYIDSSMKKIHQRFEHFVQDKDGGFAITGSITDTFPNHDPSEFNSNIWFVTLDKDGCFNGDCGDTIRLDRKIQTHMSNPGGELDHVLEFYPNPAKDVVNIQFKNSEKKYITIFDGNGKLIQRMDVFSDNLKLQVGTLSPGRYLVRIEDDAGKWIVMPLQVMR